MGITELVSGMARAEPKAVKAPPKVESPKSSPVESAKGAVAAKQKAAKEFVDVLKKQPSLAVRMIVKEANLAKAAPSFQDVQKRLQEVVQKAPSTDKFYQIAQKANLQHSAVAAEFLEEILMADSALRADARYVIHQGSKALWRSVTLKESAEAQAELAQVLARVREQVVVMPMEEPLDPALLDFAFTGGARGGSDRGPRVVEKVLDENDNNEKIKNLQLREKLREINFQIAHNPRLYENRDVITQYLRELADIGYRNNVPGDELQEAISRVDKMVEHSDRLRNNAEQAAYDKRKKEAIDGGRVIEWDMEKRRIFKNDHRKIGEILTDVRGLTQDDLTLILGGQESQLEWLSKFRQDIYEMGKDQSRPSFTDEQIWNEFEKVTSWLWGDEQEYVTRRLKKRWESFGRIDGIVKGLSQGGNLEMKLKAFQSISTRDFEDLLEYDLVEYTRSLYSDTMRNWMENRAVKWFEAKEWLDTKVANPFHHHHFSEPLEHLAKEHELSRQELLLLLKEKASQDVPGGRGALTEDQYMLWREIQLKKDFVGDGVILKDEYMTADTRKFDEMAYKNKEYRDLEFQNKYPGEFGLTPEQMRENEVRMAVIKDELNVLWRKYTLNEHQNIEAYDRKSFNANRGLSPIEIEIRERLLGYLRAKPEFQDNPQRLEDIEWKIKDAIWAARNLAIGSGEAMEIAARMAIAPEVGLSTKSGTAKYVMEGSFAEPIVRAINEGLFESRFSLGGKLGKVTSDMLYSKAMEHAGYDIMKNGSQEWKNKLAKAGKEGKPKWRVVMDYAQEELGMAYTEVLRPEVLATGLTNVSTNWRNERAIRDPMVAELMRLIKEGKLSKASLVENEGIGIQFQLAETLEEKKRLVEKAIMRKPAAIISYLGSEFHNKLRDDLHIDISGRDWMLFQRALTNAEMSLWDNPETRTRVFDFSNRADFDLVVPKMLDAVGLKDRPPGSDEKYYNVMVYLKNYMNEGVGSGGTRLERFAKHGFKNLIPLVSSDFNWKESNYTKVGLYTQERRINDFINMSKARDVMFDILYNKGDLLSPMPGKEVDTILKIQELRDIVVGYAGPDDAEKLAALILDVVLDFNENKAIRSPFGWIPGYTSLMRNLGTIELEDIPIVERIPAIKHFLEENNLAGRKLMHLPQSLAGAISPSVQLGGPEGNAWDEFKIAGILAAAEHRFMFVNNPHLLSRLKTKYRTGFGYRVLATYRKYWWVVPLATIALATSQAVDEESKKSGGGGHH